MKYKPNAFKVTLMIPMRDNDGRPFPPHVWGWWIVERTRTLKDFTDAGQVIGVWQRQTERNRMLIVVLRSENAVSKVRKLLRRARKVFGQKVMYLDCQRVYHENVR